MRSMTGFGVGEAALAPKNRGKLTVEIRAVNHRFLDVRVRVPNQLPDLAVVVETLARERLQRGRFDVTVHVDASALGGLTIDVERARSAFRALQEIRDEIAPGAEIPLSILGSIPELFVPAVQQDDVGLRAATATAIEAALRSLDDMRIREGVSLGEDLLRRLATVRKLYAVVAARSPVVVEIYKKRLKEKAERLRVASDIDVDAGRLEQELAIYADRIDVAEELTRLESHASHFELLLAGPEAVGRRLDFLLQEMAREANTIGSKSQDASIAHSVVELKAEIERMREQVQNIE